MLLVFSIKEHTKNPKTVLGFSFNLAYDFYFFIDIPIRCFHGWFADVDSLNSHLLLFIAAQEKARFIVDFLGMMDTFIYSCLYVKASCKKELNISGLGSFSASLFTTDAKYSLVFSVP